jgi:glycosyltransferase involved in cell wall biosynthesis
MYILMIARGIPSERYPQWGCFEKDQAEALVALGHKVVVASVDSRFVWSWRKIGITRNDKNGIVFYNSFLIPGALTGLFGLKFNLFIKQWQMQRIYKRLVKEQGKPDIICGHFSFSTCNAVPIAIDNHIPLIGIEHNAIFNEDKLSPHTYFTSNYAYQHTQQIIAVSKNLQARIKYHLGKESVVVHNTVGKEFLEAPEAEAPDKLIKFVAVGNLIFRKGYDLLIQAFTDLDLPHDSWVLNIIGDGEEEETLQHHINTANLQNNIFLLGKKNKKEIVNFLTSSHVFMMPSRNENFSVAILEALACGLPIVASDCGGVRDCINDSNGIIFPIDNVEELKKAILKIYNRDICFDNQSIATQCKENFAPKVIAQKLINVFKQTIEQYETHTNY